MQNKFLLIKTLIDYILTIYFAQNLAFNIKMANKKTQHKYFKSDDRFEIGTKKYNKKTLLPDVLF